MSIVTSCEDCVFAQYEGDTQAGCEFDRIRKFESRGDLVKVVESEGRAHYEIGRYCTHCHNPESKYLKGTTMEEWKASVEEVTRLRISVIALAHVRTSESEVRTTLESVANQALAPARVIVVLDYDDADDRPYVRMIRDLGFKCPFHVVRMEPGLDYEAYPQGRHGMALDEAVKLCRETYYCVVNSGAVLGPHLFEKLDRAINRDLSKIVAVMPDEGLDGGIVQLAFHKHDLIRGNKGMDIFDKLRWWSRENDEQAALWGREELPCS